MAGGQNAHPEEAVDVDDSPDVSAAVVYYTARTGNAVTLDDAANEGRFTHDPYIRRRRLKSVHCAPLFNKGAMIGILYLENLNTVE